MYVDGGVTGNIIYGGRIAEEDSLVGRAGSKQYPDLPIPKMRYWVIFNNQFRPTPQVTEPQLARGRHAQPRDGHPRRDAHRRCVTCSRWRRSRGSKRKADVEVRIVSIPGDWTAAQGGARSSRRR